MFQITGIDKSNQPVYFNGVWQRHPNKAGKWEKTEACRIASIARTYNEIRNVAVQEAIVYAS